ncbi:MAG: tryptophan--tRNA ligase [Thermotogae bacterium]|nr:tryptophan--tRNA ligase [Thermotogota bacterium]
MAKKVILSGMRPTGRMHVGHLAGVLTNWVRLQDEYECYYEIADWHALTDDPKKAKEVEANVMGMVRDWLAVGIDPRKAVIFRQSYVPEHAELHLLFSMLVSVPRLLRNPTFKEKLAELRKRKGYTKMVLKVDRLSVEDELEQILRFIREEDERKALRMLQSVLNRVRDEVLERITTEVALDEAAIPAEVSYGLLGYPVLQAADILLYKGEVVPVGADQLPHLELTREIARDFNRTYAPIFPIPEPLLTETPKILGTDGRKMSKSYGNAIFLSDPPEVIERKVRSSITDPMKVRRNDPGRPEVCPIFHMHKVFNAEEAPQIEEDCRAGKLGCVACKGRLARVLIERLTPIRERAESFTDEEILDVIREGSARAKEVAERTMGEVREAVFGREGIGSHTDS